MYLYHIIIVKTCFQEFIAYLFELIYEGQKLNPVWKKWITYFEENDKLLMLNDDLIAVSMLFLLYYQKYYGLKWFLELNIGNIF